MHAMTHAQTMHSMEIHEFRGQWRLERCVFQMQTDDGHHFSDAFLGGGLEVVNASAIIARGLSHYNSRLGLGLGLRLAFHNCPQTLALQLKVRVGVRVS